MKALCDRAALQEAANHVCGVVAARTPRPQLSCVHLLAERVGDVGQLTLSAANAEVSLRIRTESVEVHDPGASLAPADKLRQIVSAEQGDPTLQLQTDGDVTTITGSDATFKIYGFPPDDFPPSPPHASASADATSRMTLPSGQLRTLIERTLFATARETSRYAINGVLLRGEGSKVEMVATDGRRLALARGKASAAESKDGADAACIVPDKALSLLSKLLQDPEEPVHLAITANQALFAIGDPDAPRAELAASLIEGAFPPYQDVIPKDQDKKAVFDASVLGSAVKRAALLTNEESRGVRMAFTPDGQTGTLKLSSRAPEMGEADIDVPLTAYSGSDVEIGFNPQFLLDALRVLDTDELALELKTSNSPGLIKSGTDFVYVVMPVNLQ